MFTPLTFNKDTAIEVDRFDNYNPPADTTNKRLGYAIPSNNVITDPGTDSTVIAAIKPDSDYIASSAGNGEWKWTFVTLENNSAGSAWWQLYISTENNTQIGNYANYGSTLGTSGLLKGSYAVSCRERHAAGSNQDGMIFINSGSYYDWNDPQPVTIGLSYTSATETWLASINGETVPIFHQDRAGSNQAQYQSIRDVTTTSNTSIVTMGYNEIVNVRFADSGSRSEFSFYTSSLTQDEMNVITNQTYGNPLNILDKQPQIHYRFTEEEKVTNNGTNTGLTDFLGGVSAFPNKGTFTDSSVSQAKTIRDSRFYVTSGSAYDIQERDYRTRE